MRLLAAALALLALALAPAGALAAGPRASLVDIEDEVMCVTCKIPLNIAEGPQPDREREFIRNLIAQGKTKAQIKQALVGQYGELVLALPKDSGFGLTAYLVPFALLVTLVAGLVVLIPRWRRRPPAGPAGGGPDADEPPELTPDDAKRLDEDLVRHG